MSDGATGDEKVVAIDWENRVLCSDESCIGVIGPDGRCKECGLVYEGELGVPSGIGTADESAPEETAPVADEPVEEALQRSETPLPLPADDDDDDWERRTLCSDGNCIGVIGPDGRCKECGQPYTD